MTRSRREALSRREAFTLVELLVVITIIGMLMAMILPAVSAVKEHARQSICINNQSEIAKAVLVFESRRSRFPGWNEKIPKTGSSNDYQVFSWPVVLLPELGRRDLYDAMLLEGPSTSRPPSPDSARSYIEYLVCPSAQKDKDHDAISYVVNSGRQDSGANGDSAANGVFHDRRRGDDKVEVSTSNLTRGDGMANTLLLSENLQADYWGFPGTWENRHSFIWWPEANPRVPSRINQEKEADSLTGSRLARPSSNHPGGVIVAFCNSSTRFLREDIDYRVHIQLMTTNHRLATQKNGRPLPDDLRNVILKEQDY